MLPMPVPLAMRPRARMMPLTTAPPMRLRCHPRDAMLLTEVINQGQCVARVGCTFVNRFNLGRKHDSGTLDPNSKQDALTMR